MWNPGRSGISRYGCCYMIKTIGEGGGQMKSLLPPSHRLFWLISVKNKS